MENRPSLMESADYLRTCAAHEGGRAALCMAGYGNAATAAYFAREAAHYARLLLTLQGACPCGCGSLQHHQEY